MLLNIGALCNAGHYDPGWLGSAETSTAVTDILPRQIIDLRVAQRHFLASRDDLRRTRPSTGSGGIAICAGSEFNPLVVHPFIEQPDSGRFVAPIPRHALTE